MPTNTNLKVTITGGPRPGLGSLPASMMTVRQDVAARLMQGLLACPDYGQRNAIAAREAVAAADALLHALEERTPGDARGMEWADRNDPLVRAALDSGMPLPDLVEHMAHRYADMTAEASRLRALIPPAPIPVSPTDA